MFEFLTECEKKKGESEEICSDDNGGDTGSLAIGCGVTGSSANQRRAFTSLVPRAGCQFPDFTSSAIVLWVNAEGVLSLLFITFIS